MRPQPEQGPVLGAERLTLGAVGEDDRPAAGLTGDGSPLPADREAGPAATEQAARLEDRDHSGGRGSGRRPPETGEMGGKGFRPRSGGRTGEDARLHQWFLQAGSTATGSAVPPVDGREAAAVVPPAVRRQTSAALTARMLAPWTASIQRRERVAARRERVLDRERPGGVRGPVDGPPRPMPDPLAEEARDDHGRGEVDGHDPERDRQRPVRRGERDERGADAEVGEGIEDGRDDVDREERDGQQREAAMELDRQEARPAGGLGPGDGQQAEAGDGAEQDQGDDAGSPGGEPQDLGAHGLGAPGRLEWIGPIRSRGSG